MFLMSNRVLRIKRIIKFESRFVFIIFALVLLTLIIFFKCSKIRKEDEIRKSLSRHKAVRYTINTEGCTIPDMQPFSKSVKHFFKKPSVKEIEDQKCTFPDKPFLKRNRTHIWIAREHLETYGVTNNSEVVCCYKQFYRPDSVANVWDGASDHRIEYADDCNSFTKSIEVKHEFGKVICHCNDTEVFTNVFIFAQDKTINKKSRRKENKTESPKYNVVVLGLDSVSRVNFHRALPRTLNYVQSKGAVELLGYTKVGHNSYPNILPLLTDFRQDELPCYHHSNDIYDNCPFIWNEYKAAGFLTAYGEDAGVSSTFNYLARGFIMTPTDYYMHTFIVEAEQLTYNNPRSFYKYETNIYEVETCLRDKHFYELLFEYVGHLQLTIKSNLFGFFWECTATHNNLNEPVLVDEKLLSTVVKLTSMDNTVLILLSDHGVRYGPIRLTEQGRLEENLPAAFVIIPLSFQTKYSTAFENLLDNANRLTSPHDIYHTLLNLLNLYDLENEQIYKQSKKEYANNRGISLFLPIPGNRTCKMAEIPEKWCSCK